MHCIVFWSKNRTPQLFMFRYATWETAFRPSPLKWLLSSRLSFSSFSPYPVSLSSTTSYVAALLTSLLCLIFVCQAPGTNSPWGQSILHISVYYLCVWADWERTTFLWYFVLIVSNILPVNCLKSIRNRRLKFCSFLWFIRNSHWREQELTLLTWV